MAYHRCNIFTGVGRATGTASVLTIGVHTVEFGVNITPEIIIFRQASNGLTFYYFGGFGDYYEDYGYNNTVTTSTASSMTKHPISNTANSHICEVGNGYFKFNSPSTGSSGEYQYWVM